MRSKKFKSLFLIAAAAAAAYMLYPYLKPVGKYAYWEELIAKDPKPFWVSEKEYREKLRAGYCWRDKKFYTAEELQPKAMVGFAGRLLGKAAALRADYTTTLAGNAYTSEDCARNKKACRLWFMPQDYTNEQWDKLFLAEKNPTDHALLAKYPEKEIKQAEDLENYLTQYDNRGFTLVFRGAGGGGTVYGSDCCKVLSKAEAEPMIQKGNFVTYLEDARVFPENHIPADVVIGDYGVGNFYLNPKKLVPNLYHWKKNVDTYQTDYSELLLMNNCGDILWQPYYSVRNLERKENGTER